MQIETSSIPRDEVPVVPPASQKQRVRNDVWHLKRRADLRRTRANAMVIGSVLAVLALVRLFYAVLTR
jgi:hypothetical protein